MLCDTTKSKHNFFDDFCRKFDKKEYFEQKQGKKVCKTYCGPMLASVCLRLEQSDQRYPKLQRSVINRSN